MVRYKVPGNFCSLCRRTSQLSSCVSCKTVSLPGHVLQLASFVDAVSNRTVFLRGTKMAVTALKSNWRKISGDHNDVSSVVSGLMEDADPELCVKLLKTPSLKNYSGVRPRLEKASKEWLSEFLNLGGVDCLLDGLTSLSSGKGPKFTEALEQIECVRCIKAVLNSVVGLEVMTANNEFTRSLVQGKRVGTYSSRPWSCLQIPSRILLLCK